MGEQEAAARELRQAMARLTRRFRAQRSESTVGMAKIALLGLLYREGAMTVTELAAAQAIQPQSLTRIVTELAEGGQLTRRGDARDRRRVLLEITPAGLALLSAEMRPRDSWLETVMSERLSQEERDVLSVAARLMNRLAE
jgi:DNA-binding MarR family transcriptional regulator